METTRARRLWSNELREALRHPSFHKAGVLFGGIQFPLPSCSSVCNLCLLGLNRGAVGKPKYPDHCRAGGLEDEVIPGEAWKFSSFGLSRAIFSSFS